MVKIHQNIKYLRDQKGWTQEYLAAICETTPTAVGYWEQNKRTPNLKHTLALSELFQVSLDNLIRYDMSKTGDRGGVAEVVWVNSDKFDAVSSELSETIEEKNIKEESQEVIEDEVVEEIAEEEVIEEDFEEKNGEEIEKNAVEEDIVEEKIVEEIKEEVAEEALEERIIKEEPKQSKEEEKIDIKKELESFPGITISEDIPEVSMSKLLFNC